MTLEPVIVADFINFLECIRERAECQPPAFPRKTQAKTDCATQQSKRQNPTCRPIAARGASQCTYARSYSSGNDGLADGVVEIRSKRSTFKKCFPAGTSTLQPSIQNLSAVFNFGFDPLLHGHNCLASAD